MEETFSALQLPHYTAFALRLPDFRSTPRTTACVSVIDTHSSISDSMLSTKHSGGSFIRPFPVKTSPTDTDDVFEFLEILASILPW